MLPSSQIAVSSMSWRVFRRARMNQGVGDDMSFYSPVPNHLYTDEYSSVAISGLLDIYTNLMILHLETHPNPRRQRSPAGGTATGKSRRSRIGVDWELPAGAEPGVQLERFYVPYDGQSRISPFQIPGASAAGRR